MKHRVANLVGEGQAKLSTFRSAHILRMEAELLGYQRNYVIYDDDDQNRLLKNILDDLRIDKKLHPPH